MVCQTRELEKLRSALENHKKMNESLVVMRRQDVKVKQQNDSHMIQLYSKYMHKMSEHDNESKKRDNRIERLEAQVEELKAQRNDARRKLAEYENRDYSTNSKARLSIAQLLKSSPLSSLRSNTLKSVQRSYVSNRIKPRPRR